MERIDDEDTKAKEKYLSKYDPYLAIRSIRHPTSQTQRFSFRLREGPSNRQHLPYTSRRLWS